MTGATKRTRRLSQEQKEAKRAYDKQYSYKYVRKRVIDFNVNSDEDMKILSHLDVQPNKTRYVKDLIMDDMNAGE